MVYVISIKKLFLTNIEEKYLLGNNKGQVK